MNPFNFDIGSLLKGVKLPPIPIKVGPVQIGHFLWPEFQNVLAHIPPHVWTTMWVTAYVLGGLLLLWALSAVKNLAGWAGVVVVLLGVTYGFAFVRGYLHQSFNPFDNTLAITKVLK